LGSNGRSVARRGVAVAIPCSKAEVMRRRATMRCRVGGSRARR
jgi:hypothetical protein